jgi:hypothetical protein
MAERRPLVLLSDGIISEMPSGDTVAADIVGPFLPLDGSEDMTGLLKLPQLGGGTGTVELGWTGGHDPAGFRFSSAAGTETLAAVLDGADVMLFQSLFGGIVTSLAFQAGSTSLLAPLSILLETPTVTLRGASGTNAPEFKFREAPDNGVSEITVRAPSDLSASSTWTLPENASVSGGVWQDNGSGVLLATKLEVLNLLATGELNGSQFFAFGNEVQTYAPYGLTFPTLNRYVGMSFFRTDRDGGTLYHWDGNDWLGPLETADFGVNTGAAGVSSINLRPFGVLTTTRPHGIPIPRDIKIVAYEFASGSSLTGTLEIYRDNTVVYSNAITASALSNSENVDTDVAASTTGGLGVRLVVTSGSYNDPICRVKYRRRN